MKTKTFVLLKGADGTLPKQAAAILQAIADNGGKATKDELVKLLTGKLKTTQPVVRVISFYRSTLIESGHIQESECTHEETTDGGETVKVIGTVKVVAPENAQHFVPKDRPLNLNVIRGFQHEGVSVLLCGSDADDHEVWRINGGAQLIGVLKKEEFSAVLKAKELVLDIDDFAWVMSKGLFPIAETYAYAGRAGLKLPAGEVTFTEPAV
jgi:hypothetical protein